MAPADRMGGDDMKTKGLEGPHYRVTDQDWKMCKSPSRGVHVAACLPGLSPELTFRKLTSPIPCSPGPTSPPASRPA